MPVQEEVIPYLLGHGNDVIALAQTGTGKTAAFGIPLLQRVDPTQRHTQAIVLSPTRELCLQIADDLKDFSKYIKGINVVAVYGGTSIVDQIHALKHGAQIIVATPGRLIDLMNRGVAQLDKVENVVLDEADEMLNMGFADSINAIFEGVPQDRNTLLFSATMSREIERIAKSYLHDFKEIVVGSRNEGAESVNHIYYMVNAKDKYLALKRIVDFYPRIFAIIFCRTKKETQEVADKLIRDGYNAESLHGDLSQQQRDLTMQKFRQHLTQLLVATDVAARGLDVDDLTHVINYGLPDDIESYTHRSGRTGRAGKKGTSISIIHTREKRKVRDIEREIGKDFVDGTLPTPKEICTKQLYKAIDEIEKADVDEEEIAPFMDDINRHFEFVDKEDILKKIVSRVWPLPQILCRRARDSQAHQRAQQARCRGQRQDRTHRPQQRPAQGRGWLQTFVHKPGQSRWLLPRRGHAVCKPSCGRTSGDRTHRPAEQVLLHRGARAGCTEGHPCPRRNIIQGSQRALQRCRQPRWRCLRPWLTRRPLLTRWRQPWLTRRQPFFRPQRENLTQRPRQRRLWQERRLCKI